jgi:drug/metabolite transporter (DMT)-like permease
LQPKRGEKRGNDVRVGSLVQLVLLGLIWGSSYLFIRVAVEGISPLMLVSLRLMFGAILLFGVISLWKLALPRDRTLWFHLVVMAVIGNVIPWTLISWAGQHIDSGLSAVLNSTTPLFTILFAVAAFHSERLTIPRVLGVILGFGGVAVLAGADVTDLASSSLQAQAAVVFSSLCYGLAFAYARRYIRFEPIVLAGCQIMLAFLFVTPFALAFGDPGGMDITPARGAAALALGLLPSGVAYILYYRLIRDVGATLASYATYLIPIVGLFLGWLVLNESITLQSIAGVALILSGLALATTFHRTEPVKDTVEKKTVSAKETSPNQAGSGS